MAPLNDVMVEFAARRAMAPPAFDPATGGFAIAVDGRYVIHLRERGRAAVASAWVSDLPNDDPARAEAVRRLLRAELGRFGVDDVVLSVDESAGEVQLHGEVASAELDADRLGRLLQRLVDGIAQRRALLVERRSAPPVAPMIIRP